MRRNKLQTLFCVVFLFVLARAGFAFAGDDEAVLAQKNGCLACHRGAAELKGPPYKQVAAKYAKVENAESILVDHILSGTGPDGVGWMKAGHAQLPFMSPNPVTLQDAHHLARWILATQEEIPDVSRFFVTETLRISGAVEQSLALTVEELRKFPLHDNGDVALVCQTGANVGKVEPFKGVRLVDILTHAVIIAPHHNDVKKMAIIAKASDGYQVVFSWTELFNSPIGDGVMVLFEKEGQPLKDDQGRIALISTKDTRTGPRHVKWLQEIEVRKIVE